MKRVVVLPDISKADIQRAMLQTEIDPQTKKRIEKKVRKQIERAFEKALPE